MVLLCYEFVRVFLFSEPVELPDSPGTSFSIALKVERLKLLTLLAGFETGLLVFYIREVIEEDLTLILMSLLMIAWLVYDLI